MADPVIPDQGTQQLLDSAYADARAQLKGQVPDTLLHSVPRSTGPTRDTTDVGVGIGLNGQQPPPDLTPVSEPPEGAFAYGADQPDLSQPPPAAEPIPEKPTMVGEVTKGLARGALDLATTLGFAAAGVTDMAASAGESMGILKKGSAADATDAVFDFLKNYVDNARDNYWAASKDATTAQKIGGGVAEGAAPMLLGPAAIPAMATTAGTMAAKESLDQGQSLTTAETLALVHGASAALLPKTIVKSPKLWKSVVGSVLAGTGLDQATQYATKKILEDRGYQKAADDVRMMDPMTLGTTAGQQAIYALLESIFKASGRPPPKKLPEAGPAPEEGLKPGAGETPPPPGPPPVAAETPAPPSTPGKLVRPGEAMGLPEEIPPVTPPVADKPTAEPVKDLQAQREALDKGERKGVYLSADNVKALGKDGLKALAGDKPTSMNFDGKGGAMIFASPGDRMRAGKAKAAARKADPNADLQPLIGELTGAGKGKTPEQTAVVQGQTPEGAVVKESAVTPAEVPAKVAEVKAAGHEPVVTTPEAAVARRETEIAKEQAAQPPEGAKPIEVPAEQPAEKLSQTARAEPEAGQPAPEAAKEAATPPPGETVQTRGAPIPDLEKAAANFKSGETAPRRRGTLMSRAQSVSGFAQILKSAAGHAFEKGTADEAAINRANAAANAAERLGSKSTEEVAKGRGIGHAELDAHARELLAASEQLQGRPAPVPEPKGAVRAAKIKARVAKAKVAVEETKTAAKEQVQATQLPDENVTVGGKEVKLADAVEEALRRKVEPSFRALGAEMDVSVKDRNKIARAMKEVRASRARSKPERDAGKVKSAIPDVVDEVKAAEKAATEEGPLRKLSKEEDQRLTKAFETYKIAGEGAASYHRTKLEKLMNELFSPNSAEARDAITNLLTTAEHHRAEWHGQTPRDVRGEIEDELGVKPQDYTDSSAWNEGTDNEPVHEALSMAEKGAWQHWRRAHMSLVESGIYDHLKSVTQAGKTLSAKDVLRYMQENLTPNNPVFDLLSHLRRYVPDYIVRGPERLASRSGNARGLFSEKSGVRVRLSEDDFRNPGTTMTFVHEMFHAATVDFLRNHPDHPEVRNLARLRDIAEQRIRSMWNDRMVTDAIEAHQGIQKMPDYGTPAYDKFRKVYGLTNLEEFVSETMTNPEFQSLLHESELYAKPNEALPTRNLISRMYHSILNMLGIKDPKAARLLMETSTTVHKIMQLQDTAQLHPRNEKGLFKRPVQDAASEAQRLQEIDRDLHESPPLRNEDRITDAIGPRATRAARETYNAVRKGDIGKLRGTVEALKSFDQIVRDGLHWFGGRDDANNPLRRVHDAASAGAEHTNEITNKAQPLVERGRRLSLRDSRMLGEFMHDSTIWGIDPTVAADSHAKGTKNAPKFDQRYEDFQKRWRNLSDEQKSLYKDVRDFNRWSAEKNRQVAIDTALRTFTDKDVTAAQRSQLYNVRSAGEYESMIGEGKAIDVGDRNAALRKSLETLAGQSHRTGPYFHLGRHGDYVVQINPEGTKSFPDQAAAEHFVEQIKALSPESDAVVSENPDGTHSVDYNADYVSMHETPKHAEAEAEMLRAKGFDVGNVTRKILGKQSAPLSAGAEQLVAEASRKLNRQMGEDAEPLVQALHTAFTQMMAARSAYAGSRLMRKGTGGVKGEEWLRNFSDHTQSLAWHTGQLSSVFKKGEALGALRTAAKEAHGLPQHTSYMRGAILNEINARLQQETAQYGTRSPVNSSLAKLGFMNYLASPSHALIWMSQNFTTSIPLAGARWGYGRSANSFGASMWLVGGPTFREAFQAHWNPATHGASDILNAVVEAVRKDKRFGKWAQGENSPLKQLMDRGAISTSFANELALVARGPGVAGKLLGPGARNIVDRVFDYARILPHMADTFNRVSTALAALELTKGDVYKSADFVRETHMDYSGGNKPRAFKAISRIPGFNSVTMFRTYTQGMAHLLYSNMKHMLTAELPEGSKSRAEAAKTVAGVMAATSVIAGVTGGALIEPARLAYYAWNKINDWGDASAPYHNLDHAVDAFLSDTLGKEAGEIASKGLPRALGFDVSSRMGLSHLFFYDPPDLLSGNLDDYTKFAAAQLGPMPQMVGQQIHDFQQHMEDGEPYQALMSLVPIKLLQDAVKAGHLMVGKQNSRGAQVVDPTAGGALTRFVGFKPAAEARAQERQSISIEYHQHLKGQRDDLVRRWVKNGYASVSGDIATFNHRNPAHAISAKDFNRARRGNLETEAEVRGAAPRDPNLSKLLDY